MKFLSTLIASTMLASLPIMASAHDKMAQDTGAPAMEAKADIVDTAIGAGSFNTLVAAIQAAGLEEALRGDGPFTVFAPTDAAFAALPEGTVEMLLKPENKDKLTAILTYHVVPGKVTSGDLVGKQLEADTLNGTKLAVDATDGVKVGNAMVTTADIETSNGVIHVIDAVLIPVEKKAMKEHRSGS